jgi:hypothetical protein
MVLCDECRLEDRVVMSTFGHSSFALPSSAPISAEAHHRHSAADVVVTRSSLDRVSAAVSPTVARWSWLADTYWFVPVRNLPAVLYNSTTGTLQMEKQMFTAPSETLQIGHWAYMVQTRPGMASWKSLPSVGESVPAFLDQGASSGS